MDKTTPGWSKINYSPYTFIRGLFGVGTRTHTRKMVFSALKGKFQNPWPSDDTWCMVPIIPGYERNIEGAKLLQKR